MYAAGGDRGTSLAAGGGVEASPMAHPAKRPSFRFASLVSLAALSGALLLASCDDGVPHEGGRGTWSRYQAQPGRHAEPGQQHDARPGRADRLHHRGGDGQRQPKHGRQPHGHRRLRARRRRRPPPRATPPSRPSTRPRPAAGWPTSRRRTSTRSTRTACSISTPTAGFMIYDVNDTKKPAAGGPPAGVRLPGRDVRLRATPSTPCCATPST